MRKRWNSNTLSLETLRKQFSGLPSAWDEGPEEAAMDWLPFDMKSSVSNPRTPSGGDGSEEIVRPITPAGGISTSSGSWRSLTFHARRERTSSGSPDPHAPASVDGRLREAAGIPGHCTDDSNGQILLALPQHDVVLQDIARRQRDRRLNRSVTFLFHGDGVAAWLQREEPVPSLFVGQGVLF